MKLVVDENIPLSGALFGPFGDVQTVSGREIGARHVADADVVIVRSVTNVDATLLSGSRVRFVGSATAGIDHVDCEYLQEAGIAFSHAPASNASSVADYVISALLELGTITDTQLAGKTLGIVGHGAVGSRLAARAAALQLNVVLNDPPRVAAEPAIAGDPRYVSLDVLLAMSDIVSLHVPLVVGGEYPTVHLVGPKELSSLDSRAWLINTSRGAVVDGHALETALAGRPDMRCVLDVWEGEPCPSVALMLRVDCGTPHIAGYAYDAKVAGAVAVAAALAAFVGREGPLFDGLTPRKTVRLQRSCNRFGIPLETCLRETARSLYDFRDDYRRFATLATMGDAARTTGFSELRRRYPLRRGFESFDVTVPDRTSAAVRQALTGALGVAIIEAADEY